MRADHMRALEEESMAAEWIQTQRETAAELILCAEETRARAREAVAQARQVREAIWARRAGLAQNTDGPRRSC